MHVPLELGFLHTNKISVRSVQINPHVQWLIGPMDNAIHSSDEEECESISFGTEMAGHCALDASGTCNEQVAPEVPQVARQPRLMQHADSGMGAQGVG